jgi:hypothetical protein
MRAVLSTLITILLLIAAPSKSIADEWEVNNIWWSLIFHYDGSDKDLCMAKNYNSKPVTAVFSVFPGDLRHLTRPVHRVIGVELPPYTLLGFFGWIHGTTGNLVQSCTLQSWH